MTFLEIQSKTILPRNPPRSCATISRGMFIYMTDDLTPLSPFPRLENHVCLPHFWSRAASTGLSLEHIQKFAVTNKKT